MSQYLSNETAQYYSKAGKDDPAWKYPVPTLEDGRHGHLSVSTDPKHDIYWHEYGNPKGEPVMFFHGGPGGNSQNANYPRFFDPERYRIILFDQRGCGESTPSAAKNPVEALKKNTTDDLIEDAEKLRRKLKVTGKMHVFGGSWGSSLAMAYAIKHPDHVASLTMRGISLNRQEDFDYFYQGNAKDYATNPHDVSRPGTYMFYPEAWKEFVEVIPPEKRGDMVGAYAEIFNREIKTEQDRKYLERAVTAWTKWEGVASYTSQDESSLGKFDDLNFAKAFAQLENHYFMHGAFLGDIPKGQRYGNYLLEDENVKILAKLPIYIGQGQFDQVCPRFQADALVAALVKHGAKRKQAIDGEGNLYCVFPPAGHSMLERENMRALTECMDMMPPLQEVSKSSAYTGTAGTRRPGR
jgi:proline iminopeptidase